MPPSTTQSSVAAADGSDAAATPPRWTLAAALACALPVAVVVALLSGALEPASLSDPGPVTRVGTIVVRVVHDLSAALTIGFLLVAAFLTPESRTSVRRATAAKGAAVAGTVWAVTAAVGMVFAFATASGLPPVGRPFYSMLLENFWSLELTRMLTLEALLAAAVAMAAAMARTRAALAWTFVLAIAPLIPLSATGHAGGDATHEQAVTSLLIHLVTATVWVGGLGAIVLLRRHLGGALEATVRRFSTVALWCYLGLALSGVLFAVLQASTLADLLTPYFLVIWAKVAALLVLGLIGALHRWWVLRGGLMRRGAFARLAVVEVAVMAAAFGLAVALSRTPPPVAVVPDPSEVVTLTGAPEPAPLEPSMWLTAWRVDTLFTLVALVAVGLYLAGVVRMVRRGDGWPLLRTVCWVLGWGFFVYLTSGAPGVYGRVMFSMHMVLHMGLMMIVPIFLVLASPVTLAVRTLRPRKDRTLGPREIVLGITHSRFASVVVNPVVAAVIFFASLVAFYWTDAFEWALTTHSGHVAMTVHFMLSGYALVWALIGTDPGPRKWPAPLRLVVLFGTFAAHAFFGLAIMQGRWLLAPGFFTALDLDWVPDLLADQQVGGTIAWGIGEMPTVLLAMLVTLDWVRSDRRETRRQDRQADRDGDAELVAYNARLQELQDRSTGSPSGKEKS